MTKSEGGGAWSFDHDNSTFGLNAAGLITVYQTSAQIDFDALEVNGINLGTPVWTLPLFQE